MDKGHLWLSVCPYIPPLNGDECINALYRRFTHLVVHRMGLHLDNQQRTTGSPQDVSAFWTTIDIALEVNTHNVDIW